MELNWIKCMEDRWCPFFTVNLGHQHFVGLSGVYIIWHGGNAPRVVYVGKGEIANRLRSHRSNPNIERYSDRGLFVTWASVGNVNGKVTRRDHAKVTHPGVKK